MGGTQRNEELPVEEVKTETEEVLETEEKDETPSEETPDESTK